jgi:hypothetical protein
MARVFDSAVKFDADPFRICEKGGPGGGQPDPSGDALENGKPELLLEKPDLPRQRRLGDVKSLRGTMEMLALGNGNEIADATQFHGDR